MNEMKNNRWYSEEHEWVEVIGEAKVRIGITAFAQHQLGDIVFVELPDVGTAVSAGDGIGTIESVKTVSDLFSPVSGKVARVNEALTDSPQLVNDEPYESGWMLELDEVPDLQQQLADLMSENDYKSFIEEDTN